MKEILFERLDAFLSEPRKRYNALMEDRKALDEILELGAEKARARAQVLLRATRAATGIR
jgi:tryptophanyl-tRNA synthetase